MNDEHPGIGLHEKYLSDKSVEKKAREGGAATCRPPGKKVLRLSKSTCIPPRERIPEVVEAVLLDAWWPERLRRQAVAGWVDGGGTGAGDFAGSGVFAFGRTGARSNSTSFSDLSP